MLTPGLICGEVVGARCELPGMLFPRCPQLCGRSRGHAGRCWCSFHEANPWTPWGARCEEVQKGVFQTVLTVLKEKNMLRHASVLLGLQVRTLEDLRVVGALALEEAGVPWEDAVLLTTGEGKKRPREHDLVDTRRADHPVIDPKTRGSKAIALRELRNEEGKEKWRKLVLRDMYAKTSLGPREATWHTWCEAARCFGRPELPLTYDLVVDCAAFFKAGGYRSVAQYFSRARQEHVEWSKLEVPPNVLMAMAKAIRSV